MLELISREKLEHTARKKLKYPLHDAEKDYFLALVMQIVSESNLSDVLVFKGGTAIHHCYLNQLRFSQDLDFTSKKKNITLDEFSSLFRNSDLFEVKKPYLSKATIKIEQLKYYGVLNTPNSIKFEVDHLQNVVLPSVQKTYQNVWGLEFKVNTMDPLEICAEKIRACNDRFRYRDFYDLFMLVNSLRIDTQKAISLIPEKEVRNPIAKENLVNNLELSLKEFSKKGNTIFYKEKIDPKDIKSFVFELDVPSFKPNV
jgi:predicted nucleotidyltransferase component of viral defense system